MTWFVSTSDIIGMIVFGIIAPVFIAGWTTLRIVDGYTSKINAAHWAIFIVFVLALWTVEGLAVWWWLS